MELILAPGALRARKVVLLFAPLYSLDAGLERNAHLTLHKAIHVGRRTFGS